MGRGFTLIELMIAIAILAIWAGVPVSAGLTLSRFERDYDSRMAMRNAEASLQRLRQQPFSEAAPRRLKVGPKGEFSLPPQLIEGSLKITAPDGVVLTADSVDLRSGQVRLPAAAGLTVTVDYAYLLSDQGEAHTVDSEGGVNLVNTPVLAVDQVWLARGDRLQPLTGWQLEDTGSGRLRLPAAARGKVVQISYWGQHFQTVVSGRATDANLKADPKGPVRVLQVTGFDRRQGERLWSVPLIKVAP